ncbi:transposable element Tcb1 transposase [Trichonephila clavipes]|nr:transposable element Tcb1 transposase [Trichonephila clavipes]
MSRRKQRSVFDEVSDLDKGRIVANRLCGLPFREIGSRDGRNQTTVMRICNRWSGRVQRTDVVDRIHLSEPLHVRTGKLVRMAVMFHSFTSRTVAQHIESVTDHSVSARTIRRRLQQSGLSARRPFLDLPQLTLE